MAIRIAIAIVLVATVTASAQTPEGAASGITSVDVEFSGNARVESPDLRRALGALLADLRDRGVDPSAVEDASYLVERYYARQGFPDAKALAVIAGRTEDRVTFRIKVVEGRRTRLGRVEIRGAARIFERGVLDGCFEWVAESAVEELIGRRQVFTPAALTDGVDCIASLHVYAGFLGATATSVIREAEVPPNEDRRIDVDIEVRPGARVRLKGVDVVGVRAFPIASVVRALRPPIHAPFDPRTPQMLRGRILDFYRSRGHREVEVEIRRDFRADGAWLTFVVDEGGTSRVTSVDVHAERTADWVVRQYVKLRPGDLYNERRVRDSYRSLLRSGLFDSVAIREVADVSDPEGVKLDVDVDEKNRYAVSMLVGYGSWEQIRGGVVLENRNVLGTGHRLRGEARASFRGERGSAEYLIPFFLAESFSEDQSVFYERREQRTFTGQEFGGEVGVGWRASDTVRHRLAYRARESAVLEIDDALPARFARDVFIGSVQATSSFDTRDRFLNPSSGLLLRSGVEYAGETLASEMDFLRGTLELVAIAPLPIGLRFVAGARTGVILPLASTVDIPVQERFFLGGDDSVRSFSEDLAGPLVDGRPLGGEAFLVANAELRAPLAFLPGFFEKLELAIFGDAGTVNLEIGDYGGGRYFFAVGTGIRYETPIGPLRLDWAFNPDRSPGDELFALHFGLGYPF